MALPVSLMAVIDAMETNSDEVPAFINRKTGEVISVSEEAVSFAEALGEEDEGLGGAPDWMDEMIEDAKRTLASDDFIPLPGQYEIHEWSIMERFCRTVGDERIRNALDRAIHGRGAFRSFKDRAHEEGVIDDWYRFRKQALREIAIEFLTDEGVAFDPDKPQFEDEPGDTPSGAA